MSIFSIALLSLYLTGIVWVMMKLPNVESLRERKGSWAYRIGFIITALCWPLVMIAIIIETIKVLHQRSKQ